MIARILETEVMDTAGEAKDYDAMDHTAVNRRFVDDFLAVWKGLNPILDVGTGTARIPITLCQAAATAIVVGIDLADYMLELARHNVSEAKLAERIMLVKMNGRGMSFESGSFGAVVSNTIVHHIPDPAVALAEMNRVCAAGGVIFVRDLARPDTESALAALVTEHTVGANNRQRQMFADSLRAALTLEEARGLVAVLGYPPESVAMTSDRHWTWCAVKPV